MPGQQLDCKVYVGDLGSEANKQELTDAFSHYGKLRNVWLARNPPGFAFVEFEDVRDAEDAVRYLDGRMICGRRARVEFSTGKTRSRGGRDQNNGRRGGGGGRGGYGGGGGGGRQNRPQDRCYECGEGGHYARDCHKYSRRGGGGGGGGGRGSRNFVCHYYRSFTNPRYSSMRSYGGQNSLVLYAAIG